MISIFTALVAALISGCMLLFIYAGRSVAEWQKKHRGEDAPGGTGTIDAAIFGLMGLLLAFTFSGASTRFEARRSLIAEEANAIGTAYLRLDLLPKESQPSLREAFRRYVRSRISAYQKFPDVDAFKAALAENGEIQHEIWEKAVPAAVETGSAATINLVSASLNAMIDITTTRAIALTAHPPVAIFLMLFVSVLVSSLLAGYNLAIAGNPSRVHVAVFVLLVGVAVFVILDYEYPRIGLIRIDPIDATLVETLEKMK